MLSRKAIAVAGLSAITIAASGCSGGSESEADKFRASFEERFGDATWYRHITGMDVADGGGRPHIEVTTDLGPEYDGAETSRTICLAAINFAFGSGAVDEIPEGAVTGSDGVGLALCA